MKKMIALLLTFVMLAALFPASIMAQAETVTKKPFYMVNFNKTEEAFTYVYDMPTTWYNKNKITPTTTEVDIYFPGYETTDYKQAAKRMKEEFDAMPEGTRHLSFNAMTAIFFGSVKDVVDMEQGVALVKAWMEKFMAEYKSIGGKLDGISIDLEYNSAYIHYIGTEQYDKGNKEIYKQIAENSVYLKRIRPKLVERGFVFYTNPDPVKYPERSELWTLHRNTSQGGNAISQSIWNQTVQELLVAYINEATYEPMIKYYPNAVLGDYKTGDSGVWHKSMDHMGGQAGYSTVKAGNASNYNAYDYTPGALFFGFSSETNRTKRTKYQKPASYNDAVFADAPFSRTLWGINDHKRMIASTDTGRINTWITFFNYGTSGTGYSNTPYYSELFYHLGMTNPEPFLGYILASDVLTKGEDDPDPNVCEYDYNLKVVDDIMKELTRVAGASDRKAIITPITWNEGFILSGMYAGGRNIWRVTPDTSKVSKDAFKVKDTAPTFRIGDVTVTFPQGRIISDGKVTQVGTCGYWVETPANVTPVITSTADRYKNAPSFADTFDTYKVGTFTTDSILPNTYWTVSGSASVQKNGESNAVALTGDTTITNTKVPEKITAGDYYAKQQVWEVQVTLPEGNYGNVVLLSCGGNDGGIKLSGGKFYYDVQGSYKELEDVSLSAGVYTVKREVDFSNENRQSSSYSVYDSAGNRLGGVENVSMRKVTLPVATISISVFGATSAVLFDDYKLYPTGVTTSLDLYSVRLGRPLADPTAVQMEDTAYRLSWMNASDQYKVARVYDAKSGTILKKIDMAPGMDGVETGVVKVSGGNPIQIALDVQDATAPNSPNYDNGNFGWTAQVAENLGLAVGEKIPYTGSDTDGGSTDSGNANDTPDGAGEEGGNIYDIIGGTPNAGDDNTGGESDVGGADANNSVVIDKSVSGGVIALIVIGSLVVLLGGALAVFLFAIKPKLTETSPVWLLKLSRLTDCRKNK